MKYVIIPIYKFIMAMYLICIGIIYIIPTMIIVTLWEGKHSNEWWIIGLKPWNLFISPYYKRNKNSTKYMYYFKSYFHFILGKGEINL